MSIGEAIMIEPMEELHILRWTTDPITWFAAHGGRALYLMHESDLEHGTMSIAWVGRE